MVLGSRIKQLRRSNELPQDSSSSDDVPSGRDSDSDEEPIRRNARVDAPTAGSLVDVLPPGFLAPPGPGPGQHWRE